MSLLGTQHGSNKSLRVLLAGTAGAFLLLLLTACSFPHLTYQEEMALTPEQRAEYRSQRDGYEASRHRAMMDSSRAAQDLGQLIYPTYPPVHRH